MTIALRAAGTIVHAATSAAPAYPAGIVAGDAVFLGAAWKLETATAPTLTGWTVVVDRTVGSGTAGVATGPQRLVLWRKDAVDGTESGTVTVTPSGTVNVVSSSIIAFSKTTGSWDTLYESGSDTTAAANLNFTAGSVIGETTSDLMVGLTTMGDNTNLGSQTFTATGATYGTAVEHVDAGTALGNAQRFSWFSRPITAGTATVATAYSATVAGTHTGGGVFIRLRETAGTAATASGSIALGGAATAVAPATVTGSISLGGTATAAVAGAATGTITLGGTSTTRAAATAAGAVTLGGTATAGTGSTAASATGTISLTGSVTARAAATGTGTVTLGGTVTARASATASGTVTLGGSVTARVPATAAGLITLSGLANATAAVAPEYTPHVYVTAALDYAPGTAVLASNGVGTAALSPVTAMTATVASVAAGTAVLASNGASTATLTGNGTSTATVTEVPVLAELQLT